MHCCSKYNGQIGPPTDDWGNIVSWHTIYITGFVCVLVENGAENMNELFRSSW